MGGWTQRRLREHSRCCHHSSDHALESTAPTNGTAGAWFGLANLHQALLNAWRTRSPD